MCIRDSLEGVDKTNGYNFIYRQHVIKPALISILGAWIRARDFDDVMTAFDLAGAAIAPIYDVGQLMEDPQVKAIDAITTIKDEDLGPLKMQNVMFRLSDSPGSIRFTGRRLGQDNEQVYGELGLDPGRIAGLRADGAI